jgi:hypothetical protein
MATQPIPGPRPEDPAFRKSRSQVSKDALTNEAAAGGFIDPPAGTDSAGDGESFVPPPSQTESLSPEDIHDEGGDGPPNPNPDPEPNPPADPIPEAEPDPDPAPPPGDTGVPDYDPEIGDIGDDLDYEVPEIGDVDFVTSSGSADPTMTPWEVTEEQTVMGQLTENYNRDSPFFEQARQRAIRQHLAGGGQNSAMAAGFGELAAMDTAFKVSFADAQTYARSAEFNAAMANQFSLAEQQFMHNALLSDQNFRQAGALQTQRIAGQLESITLDYQGRASLLGQQHSYGLDMLYAQADLMEGQAGRDFGRTMTLNGMTSMTNFFTNGINGVLQAANNPNFTPEQQSGAMQEGMLWLSQQFDLLQGFWGQWGAGGPISPSQQPSFIPSANDTSVTDNWWSFVDSPFSGYSSGG